MTISGGITWCGVTIAWARPDDLRDFGEADLAALGASQLDRYRQLSGHRSAGFLAGRALIRDLVWQVRGHGAVTIDSQCMRCGDAHAAPRVQGVAVSVSHADDLVVVAVSTEATAVGVDVEADSAAPRIADLAPMFAQGGLPDLAGWTRIEAVVKADGRGIEVEPSTVQFSLDPPGVADDATWMARLPGSPATLRVVTLAGPSGYTLSVARD
ncbi:4-phosphopantetheinyl transferase [Microbacterium sp. NPDC076768]|uniref:4'-phosphopantetheinyl transferase family protein n=1 Tax=Microbacterium sp. NPDC076768 TaxID=3154858 RepID=UPI00341423D1